MSSPANPVISRAVNYLHLCRVSNLPTVWTNLLAGYLLSGGGYSAVRMSLLFVAVSAAYCGGMAMNDRIDCHVDRVRRPARPIPSGRVTAGEGTTVYLVLLLTAAIAFAAQGYISVLVAGLFLVALVIVYNISHARSSLSVLAVAGCRFMIYIVAGLVFSGRIGLTLLMAATVQFFYVTLLSCLARREKRHGGSNGGLPLIPLMLAGISLVDGLILAQALGMRWLAAGLAGGAATLVLQRKFRGD